MACAGMVNDRAEPAVLNDLPAPQLLPQDHCAFTENRSGFVELVQVTGMSVLGPKVAPSEGAVRNGVSGTLPTARTAFVPLLTSRTSSSPVATALASWPM